MASQPFTRPFTLPLSLMLIKWRYLFIISPQTYVHCKSFKNWVAGVVFWPTSRIHSSQTHVLEYKGAVIHFYSSASLIRKAHCSCHALGDITEISRLRALDSDAAKKKCQAIWFTVAVEMWGEKKKAKLGCLCSLTPEAVDTDNCHLLDQVIRVGIARLK